MLYAFALCSYSGVMDDSPLSPLSPAGPDSGPGEDTVFAREALAVARGIGRLFARNGIWCLPEMPLRNGRRADLMGVDAKGRVVIVEIKVSRADLLGDAKWTDYLDHCDRFYWGLAPHLDRAVLEDAAFRPEACGIIVADGYDAEILRPAPSLPLAAARRKVEVERLARAALRRLVVNGDPACSAWG
ncbi:MAG: MmcB family DNA repair protein [Novosphingobium aromaticivorans]|uniref:DNA repair protein MmcB-related protein n=2 Tax=Novosphingobium pituita TaxID=3056842 RepID=A0ABQ6P893_9SPHN|nr:MmcB family DNA repair protein [Novosphingobium aromaticivorans]GMM61461.1 hypothetical protein NUTIK01_22380 [Novosphingobium sp. IK01]